MSRFEERGFLGPYPQTRLIATGILTAVFIVGAGHGLGGFVLVLLAAVGGFTTALSMR